MSIARALGIFGDTDELLELRKQEMERHGITFGKLLRNSLQYEFKSLIL